MAVHASLHATRVALVCALAAGGGACAGASDAPVPRVGALQASGDAVSFYSARERKAIRLALGDGRVTGSFDAKPPLFGAWVFGDLVFGYQRSYEGATPALVAIERGVSSPIWSSSERKEAIRFADASYLIVGRKLLEARTGKELGEYAAMAFSASPDMLVVCDDNGRASAVHPRERSVYWQRGACGAHVAVSATVGARVRDASVEAFAPTTGDVLWTRPAPAPLVAAAMGFEPLATDGQRVVAAAAGKVHAFAADDGRELWTAAARGPVLAGEGVVAVLSGFAIRVLDGATGVTRFVTELDGDPEAELRAALAGRRLLVRTDEEIAAYDVESGAVAWRRDASP